MLAIKNILIYLIFFLVGDIIFSNFIYKKDFNHNCYTYTKDFFYLTKNCYAKEKWVRNVNSYDVYTDSNGYRFSGKKETENLKKKSAIFFGDSFTYGMGLDYKKTFVGMVENKKKDFKILNLGVPGYSPSVFNYQFKEVIKKNIIPNKIFYVLDISDVSEEASQWGEIGNDNYPVQINRTKDKEIVKENINKKFIHKNFKGSRLIARKINNFFRSIRLSLSKEKNKDEDNIPGYSGWGNFLYMHIDKTDPKLWYPIGFDKAINKITAQSKEIALTAKSINADLYIIIYPWPDSLQYGQEEFNWEIFSKNLCFNISCKKVINFFPEFEIVKQNNKDWLNKLYINGDLHITEYGHKIIAERILKEVF